MRRSFGFSVLTCPRCGDRMQPIAAIEDSRVAGRILAHLGLPTRAPPRGRSVLSVSKAEHPLALDPRADEYDGVDPLPAAE